MSGGQKPRTKPTIQFQLSLCNHRPAVKNLARVVIDGSSLNSPLEWGGVTALTAAPAAMTPTPILERGISVELNCSLSYRLRRVVFRAIEWLG
jgi:hypothetical protein